MASYWIQAARRLGWDRNPLRRPVDRAEALIMTLLLAVLVIAGPLLAVAAGRAADAASLRAERAERGWYQAPATLLQSADQAVVTSGEMDVAWVRAVWSSREGRRMTGTVAAPLNARAGQRVEIWLTPAGQEAYPRVNSATIRGRVAIAAGFAVVGWCAVVGLVAVTVRALADRKRMAGWQRDWDSAGPRWSHRG